MKTLCIVPCGSKKIWKKNPNAGPMKAKDVYIGPFASKCQQYAKHFYPESWCILSAKHGFLFPNEIIPENYNVTFNNKKTNPISISVLKQQAKSKSIWKYEIIVILGGKEYEKIAKAIFSNVAIETPLKGAGGIGKMMQRIDVLININTYSVKTIQ